MNEVNKKINPVAYVKATLAFEGYKLTDNIIEIYKKCSKGVYTEQKAISEILRISKEES